MEVHHDSALHLLEHISPSLLTNKYNHAVWCLLKTYVENQIYHPAPSDSFINIALQYFEKHNNIHYRAMALNEKGYLYWCNNQAEEAMPIYLKAEKEVEQIDGEYELKFRVHSFLGHIYIYQNLYDYAETYYKKAYKDACNANQISLQGGALAYLARVYRAQKEWKKTIANMKQAIVWGEKSNNLNLLIGAYVELAGVYNAMELPDSAIYTIHKEIEIIRKNKQEVSPQSHLVLGKAYTMLAKIDSAVHYLNLAAEKGSIYTQQGAYNSLLALYKYTKDYQKAVECSNLFWKCTDSIQKLDKSKILVEMQNKYNQQKVINEKNRIAIERDQSIQAGLFVTIFLLISITSLIYIYQHKLNRKKEELHRNALRLHENEMKISYNEQVINDLQEQIANEQDAHNLEEEQLAVITTMQQQNASLRTENLRLQKHIDNYKKLPKPQEIEALKVQSERIQQLEEREKELAEELAINNELMRCLREKPKFLEESEWEKLRLITDKVYNLFTERIVTQFPQLTEVDTQLCILIKLRFTVSQIAILTAVSPTTVSVQKQRLKKRILQTDEQLFKEGQNLDMWIWRY